MNDEEREKVLGITDYQTQEYFLALVRQIMKRSGKRCECRGQCGMNHTDRHNQDGRCGLLHGKVYQFPDLDRRTGKTSMQPVRVMLQPIHLNHEEGDFRLENLAGFCQACRVLHSTRPWKG